MNTVKKRILSGLLVFAMVAGLFVGISFTSKAATTYNFYVMGEQFSDTHPTITDGASGTATYDHERNILTLTNFQYSGDGHTNGGIIYYGETDKLTIKLVGVNKITTQHAAQHSAAIKSDSGDIEITGDGDLEVTGPTSQTSAAIISNSGSITINANVKATGGPANDTQGVKARGANSRVVIEGGNVTISAGNDYGKAVHSRYFTNTIRGTSYSSVSAPTGTVFDTHSDVDYENGGADVKKMTFPLPAAEVTKAPEAKNLTETGSAQKLVTEGAAQNGTMQYALGTSATTVPTTGFSDEIPKGTTAGTYYVWYKAKGDDTHSDSTPKCVTVTIKSATLPAATVATKPSANVLTENGLAQALVTAGTATGGTMQYALGKDASTVPTSFSATIPTGTDAGTYYVWYKAVGDTTHTDSTADCVEVTIKAKSSPVTPAEEPTVTPATTTTTTTTTTATPTATPTTKTAPKTGDAMPIVAITFVVVGASAIGVVVYRRRRS